MNPSIPRTVKAVDTSELIRLDAEAIERGLNRNHGAGWLVEFADPEAVHYLRPVLVHRLAHRPAVSPHWRCTLLLMVRDGQQVFSLLDVLPDPRGHRCGGEFLRLHGDVGTVDGT
ncbi:hypothetical protein ACLQ2S_05800 [Micromonospora sp. DT48]|uniref:hypothetical protein n=1 Tax=Micromonospora sp. DT48 TaxID=3393429 RepID=UPI003CF98DEA